MRVEYENTFSDLLWFNVVHQFLSLRLHAIYLLLFAFIFWSESHDASLVAAAVIASVWYIAAWLVQFLINVIYLYSRNNPGVLTRHVVEVRDDAFYEATRFNKSFFYWPGVVKAVTRPGFVAVYVTPHMAHVIPNRAFVSRTQRRDFVVLIRAKIRTGATLQLEEVK